MIITVGFIYGLSLFIYSVFQIRLGRASVFPILLLSMMIMIASVVGTGAVISEFASMWSRRGAEFESSRNIGYFVAISVSYLIVYILSLIIYPPKQINNKNNNGNRSNAIIIVSLVFSIISLIHFFCFKIDILWRNDQYLLIGTMESMKSVTAFTLFIVQIGKLIGVCSWAMLAISIINRNRLAMLTILPAAIWFMIYAMAASSRVSVLLPGVAAVIFFSRRSTIKYGVILSAFSLFNLLISLQKRSSEFQGISSFFKYGDIISSIGIYDLVEPALNIFEGVFVQGEVFLYSDVDYNPNYQLLSMSPFPSFVDGFNNYLSFQFRFHEYVPISATGEIYLFGVPYLISYFLIVLTCYFIVCINFNTNRNALSFVSLCIFLLASHIQFSYPTRNVLRFFIISAMLPSVFLILRSIFSSLTGRYFTYNR